MNLNGNVTVSDVWLWCKWLYFYPGDWLLGLMIQKFPLYANSLELSYDDYGGFHLGIISFFVYSSLLWMLIKTIEEIKEDFDRWRANRNKKILIKALHRGLFMVKVHMSSGYVESGFVLQNYRLRQDI